MINSYGDNIFVFFNEMYGIRNYNEVLKKNALKNILAYFFLYYFYKKEKRKKM